jgi:DNA polymerase IV
VRPAPTILHLDMDAFFAAAEQAAKPSLRGKAVVVGGLGPRGVVSTASYEARRFGVHSAMPMAQARRLAPNAAYLVPRFALYRAVSEQVMQLLGRLSPLVEPLSLDEAFVDLEAGGSVHDTASALAAGERLRQDLRAVTGLSGSVGLAGSKMLAKIASEQAKPDGLVLLEPGTERELLGPMTVRILPGVGPATGEQLRRAGMTTVAELAEAGEDELVRLLGKAHGGSLYRMACGHDDRPVVPEREAKSVSVEDTFDIDLHDRVRVGTEVDRLADRCVTRLRAAGHSGRTVVLKVRRYDFSTLTRSETLRGPTDDAGVVREAAGRLLESVDTTGGVRLLGVGVTGLADFTQEDLFAQAAAGERAAAEVIALARQESAAEAAGGGGTGEQRPPPTADDPGTPSRPPERPGSAGPAGSLEPAGPPAERRFPAGHDVRHSEFGAGWVQGSGVRRVTVRFEEPGSPPGRVRTFWTDDPALELSEPLPLVPGPAGGMAGPGQSSWPGTRPNPLSESGAEPRSEPEPESGSGRRSERDAGRSGGPGSGRGRP